MKLTDLTDTEYSRAVLSVHEAGHAVAAVLAGARIDECRVHDDGGHVFPDRELSTHAVAGMAWAGPYAEAVFIHGSRPRLDALRTAFANTSDEDRTLMGGAMARHIESEVEFAMPAIRKLAATLYRRGSLRTLDVHLALGVRPGMDIDMVRHLYRQQINPRSVRPAGVGR